MIAASRLDRLVAQAARGHFRDVPNDEAALEEGEAGASPLRISAAEVQAMLNDHRDAVDRLQVRLGMGDPIVAKFKAAVAAVGEASRRVTG